MSECEQWNRKQNRWERNWILRSSSSFITGMDVGQYIQLFLVSFFLTQRKCSVIIFLSYFCYSCIPRIKPMPDTRFSINIFQWKKSGFLHIKWAFCLTVWLFKLLKLFGASAKINTCLGVCVPTVIESRVLQRYFYTYVQNSIIHNS